MDSSTITPTARQLRALAHPVRLRMLGKLRAEGPATATSLAQALGLNTGATSYHLRQLATHGFVEDDPDEGGGRGTGRERWWRATATSTRTVEPPEGDLEAGDANDAYLQTVVTVYAEQLQRSVEELPLLPRPWRSAATYSDWHHRLTAAQARELVETLDRILSDVPDSEDDDASVFVVNLNAYPRPGTVPVDPRDPEPEGDRP